MVSGTFQGLSDQKQIGVVLHVLIVFSLEVAPEEQLVNPVDFAIGAQDVAGGIKLTLRESLPYLLQHLLQNLNDSNELLRVRFRQAGPEVLHALTDSPKQIADALQFGAETQASEQLARFQFANISYCAGKPLVNLLLDAIEFFFAIAHSQKGHAGRIVQEVLCVECCIARHQTCTQRQLHEWVGFIMVRRMGFFARHSSQLERGIESGQKYFRRSLPDSEGAISNYAARA
jgi:hypothetical protein